MFVLFGACVCLTVLQVEGWDSWSPFFDEQPQYLNEQMAENTGGKRQSCICVPYWQCKEDYSGLIEDGIDIIDIRVLRNVVDQKAPCTGDFDVCCKVQCGHRYQLGIGYRITGSNNEAFFGEFPWMVGIIEGPKYRCGGSLIHPQVAVTAAHCVSVYGNYVARVGEHNWEKSDEPLSHQDVQIRNVIQHPGYHPGSLKNDIALVVFHSPVRLAQNVGIVCLPPPGARLDFTRCIASGWGKNSFGDDGYQAVLKKTDLPIVPRSRCVKSFKRSRLGAHFNLHHSFICAGGEENKDTCKGDGGSPLVCPIVGHPERYQQAGIVSWGLTCGTKNTPGVYANVALFTDWIDMHMSFMNFDTNIYKP